MFISRIRQVAVLALLLTAYSWGYAQERSCTGTQFTWASLPFYNSPNATENLYLYSDSACQVTITCGNPQYTPSVVNLSGGQYNAVTVNHNGSVSSTSSGTPFNGGYFISSTRPISVVAYAKASSPGSVGATQLYPDPDPNYPTEYVVQTFPVGASSSDRANFCIVQPYNLDYDTQTVSITAKGSTSNGWAANTTHQVTMHEGQVLQIEGGTGQDLSGTIIQSKKPVVVFSGNNLCHIPINLSGGDLVVSQLMPTSEWGTDFVIQGQSYHPTDYYRVTALRDSTIIYENNVPIDTINAFQTFQDTVSTPRMLHTSSPVEVFDYSGSRLSMTEGADRGDPAMSAVLPNSRAGNRCVFPRLPLNYRGTNYQIKLSVVTPTSDTSQIYYNGFPITGFSNIGSTGLSYANFSIAYSSTTNYFTDSIVTAWNSWFLARVTGSGENWEGYSFDAGGFFNIRSTDYSNPHVYLNGEVLDGNNVVLCAGGHDTLTASITCQWILDSVAQTGEELELHFDEPGTHTVTMLIYNILTANTEVHNYTIQVQPYEEQVVEVRTCDPYVIYDGQLFTESGLYELGIRTASEGCDTLVKLQVVLLPSYDTVDHREGTPGEPFTWIDGNTYTSNNNSAVVWLHTTEGCDSVVHLDLVYPTGIEESEGGWLQIAPNPTNGRIVLTLKGAGEEVEVRLMDMKGRDIKHIRTTGSTIPLDLTEQTAGNYMLQVVGPRGSATRRIVLTR